MPDVTEKPVKMRSLPEQSIASCGDVSCEFLVDPIPRPDLEPMKVRLKPEVAEVILMDNSKPNSLEIMTRAHAELRKRGVKVRDQILTKAVVNAFPIDGAQLAQLSKEKGLVLSGVND
jgi:hypothetical protein